MTSNNTTSNNTASTQLTPPLAAPLGGFQDIDGRRIFVHRAGSGDGPAVVFLPGASAVGLDYFGIQQQVAQFTTAVVYDRAGTGYSDPAALPRTAAEVATELHELLHAQGIAGPYVLVAHSSAAPTRTGSRSSTRRRLPGWSGWTPSTATGTTSCPPS